MTRPCTIEPAGLGDREAILAVMRPANMHHVPSAEMGELELSRFFVARVEGRIVGAGGYELVAPRRGKTTLLAVLPEYRGMGIGAQLQEARLDAMRKAGVDTVVTNADRPPTIDWYKRAYGYREVGRLAKVVPFGDPSVGEWTTLELDLRNGQAQ